MDPSTSPCGGAGDRWRRRSTANHELDSDIRWLIFGESGLASDLAGALVERGLDARQLPPPPVRPTASDLPQELARLAKNPAPAGVVLLLPPGAPDDAEAPALRLLHLIRALDSGGLADHPLHLRVVTRGAMTASPGDDTTPASAAAWGFARSLAAERPDWSVRLVDLEPGGGDGLAALLAELPPGEEPEVAWRQKRRLAPRLETAPPPLPRLAAPEDAWALRPAASGRLEDLVLAPVELPAPGPGQLLLQVELAGLNFRDLLVALGMLPGTDSHLGEECVGRVLQVGPGVEGLAPGDRVVTTAPGALASHVLASAALTLPLPDELAPEVAATSPVAWTTALLSLRDLADLQPGQRVLVHAGAGGVGMAAIAVARWLGARVLATASTPAKRAAARERGAQATFDSRSLDFVDGVRDFTGGEGLDAVLNSLSGPAIPAGLGLLKPGGAFVEIGKRDTWTPERVAEEFPDLRYHRVALDRMADQEPRRVRSLVEEVLQQLAADEWPAIPVRPWEVADLPAALAILRQARHVGRLVVRTRAGARAGQSWLITGGLGALGRRTAAWLADRGVAKLVLASRSASDAHPAVDSLREDGVEVVTARLDVTDPEQVDALVARLAQASPPLRGVVHAAGILDDATVGRLSADQLRRVMAAKLRGAWNLHRATAGLPLSAFVLYSSAAAVLGAPGQSAYAAANAALDALAEWREARGLPATSVAWGPWDAGMGAALSDADRARLQRVGLDNLDPQAALTSLAEARRRADPWIAVLDGDPDRLARGRPLLGELAPRTPTPPTGRGRLARDYRQQPRAERQRWLRNRLAREAARVLGVPPQSLADPEVPLAEHGLDSLMAVELRSALADGLGTRLPSTLLFDRPTLGALAQYISTEILGNGEATDGASDPRTDPPTSPRGSGDDALRRQVARLSPEDLARLVDSELDAWEQGALHE